jgi:hypothetical protein
MIIHNIRELIDLNHQVRSRWGSELFDAGICYCDQENAYVFPDGHLEPDMQEAWCRMHNIREKENVSSTKRTH